MSVLLGYLGRARAPRPIPNSTKAQAMTDPADLDSTHVHDAPVRTGRSRWLTWVAGVVGLLLVGGAVGHFVTPPTVMGQPVLAVPTKEDLVGEGAAAGAGMPDVLGLDEVAARRALADAGIDANVAVKERAAAGPAGLVVDQEPNAGDLPPEQVRLVVSRRASTPEVVDKPIADARGILEKLGAVVRVERVVRPDRQPGRVLGSAPAAGEPLGQTVVLQVSDPGQALSLADLEMIDGDCDEMSDGSVNGHALQSSISCSPYSESPSYGVWNLGRKVAALTAVLGVEDTGTAASGRVTIIADGDVVLDRTVTFGTDHEVRVPLDGVLRLRIETTSNSDDGPTVVIGDAALVSTQKALGQLEGAQ